MTERAAILTKFMTKMRRSGYGEATRKQVLLAGLTGYFRMVERELSGGMRVNRSRTEGEEMRRARKLVGASKWFKTKPLPSPTGKEGTPSSSSSTQGSQPGP